MPEPPRRQRVGIALAEIALILPMLSGSVLLLVKSSGLALAISGTTVVATAILLAIDASRLGSVDADGREREGPGLLFLGMCFLWIILYPYTYFRRRHFSGPNLGIPAVLVALFFVGSPILPAIFQPGELPACDSREVQLLLGQVVRRTPWGANARFIDAHREISYDDKVKRRQGECLLHTPDEDIIVEYIVQWHDHESGRWEVIVPPVLPSCTNREVRSLLERVIRASPLGAQAGPIDGYRELRYDREANRRQGQCVVHSAEGDRAVDYAVQWLDREAGQFEVRILPTEPPSCASREVVARLERLIREAPVGASAETVDGHRDLSYDEATKQRRGECVVHSGDRDVIVRYSVRWRDRDAGQFEVQLAP